MHDGSWLTFVQDKNDNGDLSWEEMRDRMLDIERTQKDMDKNMHEIENALGALDHILAFAVLIAAGLIYGTCDHEYWMFLTSVAAFFSTDFFSHFTIMTTTVMSFSFAFAGTVQEFAGSCIFLFVKHPYDVGDRVSISENELIVRHISLLYTQFRRLDTNKIVQIPNIVLNSDWIDNLTRSGCLKERIPLTIDPGTSSDEIELLQQELQDFVRRGENKRHYQPYVNVDISSVGDLKTLTLQVEYGQKGNWSSDSQRYLRRNRFLTEMISALRRVPIYCPGGAAAALGSAFAPAYSVSVSHEEAQAASAKHAEDLAAKKMAKERRQVPQRLGVSATGVDGDYHMRQRLGSVTGGDEGTMRRPSIAPRTSSEVMTNY